MKLKNVLLSGLIAAGLALAPNSFASEPKRNTLECQVNHSNIKVNGQDYESGMTIDVSGDVSADAKWIELNSKFDTKFYTLGLEKEDATEKMFENTLNLNGRTTLYSGGGKEIYLGGGVEFDLFWDELNYENYKGHYQQYGIGPAINAGLKSKNADLELTFATMLGEKSSSYEHNRDQILNHLQIQTLNRAELFKLPLNLKTKFELRYWHSNESNPARESIKYKQTIQPEVMITKNLWLNLKASYESVLTGIDVYNDTEVGGGLKLKW